jgi:hypothetical protein
MFFVNLANFYYTRDIKSFDHAFAIKENKIAFLIGLLPSIIVLLIIFVILLTENGITIEFPVEKRWLYLLCISAIFLLSTRALIYKVYDTIITGRKLTVLDSEQYKRYSFVNILITFIPLISLFIALYIVYD